MKILTPLLLILLLSISQLHAQKKSRALQIQEQFIQYHDSFPQEKVYIHHDKQSYLLGENIWFKAYLMDASSHTPSPISNLLYVELLNPLGEVIEKRNIKIVDGGGQGDIKINPRWPKGTYYFRAYTQYMRNYDEAFIFQKEIPIYDVYPVIEADNSVDMEVEQKNTIAQSSAISLQFFPEGGDMVEGLTSILGMKAVDSTGNGIKIQGWVKDEQGNNVTNFSSLRFGLGFFQLQPEAGKTYYAEVETEGKKYNFELPQALKSGYVLKAQMQGEQLILDIKTNIKNGLDGGFLIGHLRGEIFGVIEGMTGETVRYRLPTNDIPEGISHFTLFDSKGKPIAERLVYIRQPSKEPKVFVTIPRDSYEKREKVNLDIQLEDYLGELLSGEVSVSVSDEVINSSAMQGHDIRSYLLLSSELKGRIENSAYFFEKDDPGRRLLLDLLMLTQGWRRFVWQDIIDAKEPTLIFPNETGITFSGNINRLGNDDKPVQSEVFLTALSNSFAMDKMLTDESGFFYFTGYQWEDTTSLIIQANVYKEKNNKKNKEEGGPSGNRNVDIVLDNQDTLALDLENFHAFTKVEYSLTEEIVQDEGWTEMLKYEAMKLKEFDLEEVVIKAKKSKSPFDRFDRPDMLYRDPDARLVMDSIVGGALITNIFDFMRGRVPGVEIIGPPYAREARIRGGGTSISLGTSAQILLDGVFVSNEAANLIDVNTVDYIDVLKGLSKTAIYGAAGANGVIAIYTGRNVATSVKREPQNGIINISHPGYYKAREFYVPTYDIPIPEHTKPDYRTTIYWNPKVRIGEEGRISLEFFTADRETTYLIQLEGITSSAQPVVGKWTFEVRGEE